MLDLSLSSCLRCWLGFGVSFVYPAYHTVLMLKAILSVESTERKTKDTDSTLVHFLTYWMIYAWFMLIEQTYLVSAVVGKIPLYPELRAVLFYWLCSLQFKGAGWLVVQFVVPLYEKIEPQIVTLYEKNCPPAAKQIVTQAWTTCAPTDYQKVPLQRMFSASRQPSQLNKE